MRSLVLTLAVAATMPAAAALASPEGDRLLAATVTGPPIRCIHPRNIRGAQTIVNSSVITFGTGRRTGYRNDIVPACAALRPDRAIITRQYTSDICEGDIFQVVDTLSRVNWGGCAFGKFTPYELPPSK